MTVPAAAAARAIASSPSGCTVRWKAVGATNRGIELFVPSTVVSVVTSRDVDEHPRPQDPALERRPVLPQRPLVVRAAHDVAERAGVEPRLRGALVVPDVDEFVAQRAGSAVSRT